jgi:hypothetical protein
MLHRWYDYIAKLLSQNYNFSLTQQTQNVDYYDTFVVKLMKLEI